MQRYLCTCIGRLTIVKMTVFPKVIYRINTVPLKIPMALFFFSEIEKLILKFVRNCKWPRIVLRQSWERRTNLGDWLQTCYKATVSNNVVSKEWKDKSLTRRKYLQKIYLIKDWYTKYTKHWILKTQQKENNLIKNGQKTCEQMPHQRTYIGSS